MDLSSIPTPDLVHELSKREAVKSLRVRPYQSYQVCIDDTAEDIRDTGPAIILVIWD